MRILVACEESQAATKELRRLGHEVYSCDIVDQSGGHPEWHTMQDVLPLLNGKRSFQTMDGVAHRIDGKWERRKSAAKHSPASQRRWQNSGLDKPED